MKDNPMLKAVYELEREVGGLANVSANDPRVKKIAKMAKKKKVKPSNSNRPKIAGNTAQIIKLLDLGRSVNEIAEIVHLHPNSVRNNIYRNKLLIKYVVIEDTITKHKKMFKNLNYVSRAFEKLDIRFTRRQLFYYLQNKKLLQDRYRIYRVKKVDKTKLGG
ncbi:hypothetical protein [Apilactobacillus xinyiensis]|uniref:hypothetical protein n=1 Tax=Apilactobacillus xinyiensis TaxID=2841032 RepID=UPI00200D9199|nr:hypothetical protein [Apilactobacillus xinyiensis]MCL0319412.1 hypothetical protein [Apilactobacillus xinyiensis]